MGLEKVTSFHFILVTDLNYILALNRTETVIDVGCNSLSITIFYVKRNNDTHFQPCITDSIPVIQYNPTMCKTFDV